MGKTVHSRTEHRLDHLKAAAKKAGVKLTHQRIEIFRELAATDEHPDADTVFRAVQQRMPTVSVDTVYRTLWMLHDLGLVATLGPERRGVRFDANLDPHHHYVCTRCGLVRDFESADLNALRVPDAVKDLGSIANAHVEVRGVCTNCQGERAEEPSGTVGTPRTQGAPRHD
jgi:Fur family transcriptional regulator, peroxide stress response regulator